MSATNKGSEGSRREKRGTNESASVLASIPIAQHPPQLLQLPLPASNYVLRAVGERGSELREGRIEREWEKDGQGGQLAG
jgi:hypothetical protein